MIGLTGAADRSDRQVQPVKPVEPVVEQTAEDNASASHDEVPVVPIALGDEELGTTRLLQRTATWR